MPIVEVVLVPSVLTKQSNRIHAEYGLDCNFTFNLERSCIKTSFQVYFIQYGYMERKYILNHYYTLRHDQKRSYIMSQGDGFNKKPFSVNVGWMSRIHPAYAMMLSFFSEPIDLSIACNNIADFFQLPVDDIKNFICNLLSSEEPTYATLDGSTSGFPINLIIEADKEFAPRIKYSPEEFKFEELDFKTTRMFLAPISIVFMPNNNCITNCIYCYADTKTKPTQMSFDQIKTFVREAKELKVRDVMITGGDFFMYRNWSELLHLLIEEGYAPDLILTKVPLSPQIIETFEKFNIRLQISVDSLSSSITQKVLHVNENYSRNMRQALKDVNASSIRFQAATVLTNINDSTENLEEVAHFLKDLDRLERWEIRVAFRSLYSKDNFESIKSSRNQISTIEKWIEVKQKNFPTEILWSPDDDVKYKKSVGGSSKFEGPICSANMSNMIILPDGAVSVCEQLYWNENFIIGDICKNTIKEIWNSSKAIGLWKRKQSSINPQSPCRTCSDFAPCFQASNRCYANIMKAYGMENFDYPDPRCVLASNFINTITHE